MAPLTWALNRLDAMRGQLFPWVPVFLGTGVGIYFLLPHEPSVVIYGGLGLAVLLLLGLARWLADGVGALMMALALIAFGVLLAGARAHLIAAPVLDFRYYGPVEGRVVIIDRSASDAVRLTLDQVRLQDVRPERVPERVRVSLHGTQGFITPVPGLKVMLTAHLSGPEGPVEPGGFDFQRMAWFRQIGAVGYTRVPALAIAPAREGRAGLLLHRLRQRIATWVQAEIPGKPGAFAAAVMAGDRSGMGREELADLRGANLAHLLAISGLHMGLLSGFVFAALRYALALIPALALRFDTRKIAAVMALVAGGGYLALSGGNVATIRAFIMIAAMFTAILFDRRALSLRAVAMAAVIILVLQPEALTEPGFQMSFAATTALVAVFGALRDWQGWRPPGWARPVLAVLISSAVAGAATAPIAAAHFNQISHYGLLANLMSVPVMGLVVMPGAVVAALLAPFGLANLALAVMRPAIAWILGVAHYVSHLEGALGHVPAPGTAVLPLIAIGGLFVMLWRGHGRLAGLLPAVLGVWLWSQVERPDLLISGSGGLVGLMTQQGRVLNKPRGEGFSAISWLENDGDPVDQDVAHARAGLLGEKGTLRFTLAGRNVVHLSGRGARERVAVACAGADLVILAATFEDEPPGCPLLDRKMLALSGPLAVFASGKTLRFVETRAHSGRRLWNNRR